MRAKLQQKQKESKEHNRHIEHHKKNDRGQGSIRSGVGNCSAFALLKYINFKELMDTQKLHCMLILLKMWILNMKKPLVKVLFQY